MEYIIYFAITIGILVFVHEFGHFAAAKLCGMRADIFAIGFGKRLLGFNKKSGFSFGDLPKDFDGEGYTDYRLCLLPLGGYVKIAGMVDESFDTKFLDEEPKPYEFRAKPVWMKVIVISAGVFMNLMLAWAVFWGANYFQGKQITKTTTIGYVVPKSAADSAGFKSGDKILAINGKVLDNWEDVRAQIFIHTLGENLKVKINRDGQPLTINVPRKLVPEKEEDKLFLIQSGVRPMIGEVIKKTPAEKAGLKPGDIMIELKGNPLFSREQAVELFNNYKEQPLPLTIKRGDKDVQLSITPGKDGKIGAMIGPVFTGPVEYKTYGFFTSIGMGLQDIEKMTNLTFSMIGKVFKGEIAFGKAFGGPIKIAQVATSSADRGIASFLYFLALLSLSLAIINIMPFPVLDGGHLIIILIEGAIKKEIPIKVKMAIQNTGFVILLLLMAFIIYNDILSL